MHCPLCGADTLEGRGHSCFRAAPRSPTLTFDDRDRKIKDLERQLADLKKACRQEGCPACSVTEKAYMKMVDERDEANKTVTQLRAEMQKTGEILTTVVDSEEMPIATRCDAKDLLTKWKRGGYLKKPIDQGGDE